MKRLILVIIAAAALLRAWGVFYGPYHADEPIVINHALAYGTWDLNPHFFKIPPLASYLLFGFYGLFYFAGHLLGLFKDLGAFQLLFVQKPVIFYALARLLLGVLPGTLSVYYLFRFTDKHFSRGMALCAASLLAFNFLHVRDSHFAYVDIGMTFLVMMTVFSAYELKNDGSLRRYLITAFWLGAATAFKYNAAVVGVALVAAHFTRPNKDNGSFLFSLFFAGAVFFFLNPFSALSFNEFWDQVHHQAQAESPSGVFHHMTYSLAGAGGWVWIVLGMAGIFLFFKKRSEALVLFSFPAVFYLILIFFSQKHERYVMPIVPFLCLAAAFSLAKVNAYKKGLAGILFLLVIVPSTLKSIQCNILFSRDDTRDLLTQWIEKEVPRDSRIAFSHTSYRPRLLRSEHQWDEMMAGQKAMPEVIKLKNKRIREMSDPARPKYELFFLSNVEETGFSGTWPMRPFDLERLKQAGVRYVTLHYASDVYEPAFYEAVSASSKLVKQISPYKNTKQERSTDAFAVTAAAYSWNELFLRERFGPSFKVYELT